MSTEETLEAMRREIWVAASEMWPLMEEAMEGVMTKARDMPEESERRCAVSLAEFDNARARALESLKNVRTRIKGGRGAS
jgi:hypothetical protein